MTKSSKKLQAAKNQNPRTDLPLLKKYSNRDKWVGIIKSGKFEENKALMTVDLTPKTLMSFKVRKIEDAIHSSSPSLATIRKYQNELKSQAVVTYFIDLLSKLVNVKDGMSDLQLTYLSEMIVDNFPLLTPADLHLIVGKALKTELYNRLDAQVVFSIIKKYWEERLNCAAHLSERKSSFEKHAPFSKDMAKKLIEQFKPFKEEEVVKKPKMTFAQFKSDKLMMEQLKAGFESVERSDGMDFDTWIRFKYENM